ncbi:MAG: hypothetical protein ACTSO3_00980 [Candidatus Heimdallarchaeaceae archaeon]
MNEIEKKEIVTEYLIHLKDLPRKIMVKEFHVIKNGVPEKPTSWEFLTLFNEPMKGPKGESLNIQIQCGKKIEDAKSFERAFERFDKHADGELEKAKKELSLKMSGLILPGQQQTPPNQNPFAR